MSKELKITQERVEQALKDHPEAKGVLETLFPEVKKSPFEDKIFVKIGQLMLRVKQNLQEDNLYTLIEEQGNIRLFNVKYGKAWKDPKLSTFNSFSVINKGLTQKHFSQMMSDAGFRNPLEEFIPIPTSLLLQYAKRSSGPRLHKSTDKIVEDYTWFLEQGSGISNSSTSW